MYAYIIGKITHKSPTQVYLECNGIGFFINISLQTYSEIEQKEEVKLYIQQIIREDAHTLYGFFTENEKNVFNHLLSISGIGPNTARLMLSSMSASEWVNAIISEDIRLIQSVKGVGPKSAQRVVIELKDKLKKEIITTGNDVMAIAYTAKNDIYNEALAALNMLGFVKNQAEKAMQKALKDIPNINSVEELIKVSLKNL